ncbi:BppU family phage baseplate upper protein [Bacillus pseudomycoides]|uniref:BppU family phage baseplate upper protein n=1 Tax=Bacillus pseudomycoides TaxID=64104 RepID=UPI000BEC9BA6|nr:BppU family phage baseplate upper protein [Bacillus pseudomycoides]PEE42785.1 hypothetical protein COO02_05545 [Bacillus pseudomycoides]
MTFKTYEINIDLINIPSSPATIRFSQNDQNSAKLLLNITNKTVEVDLSLAKSVKISFKKPDGTRVFQDDCQPINALKGKYQVILKTQTLTAIGNVMGQVQIEEDNRIIETQKFWFVVDESLMSDGAIESSNDFSIIQKAIDAGEKLEELDFDSIIAAGEKADTALAKSTQNTNQIGILLNDEIGNALVPKRERRPIITFLDDDGRKDVLTKWKPTLIDKKIPMTIPLVTSAMDVDPNYMTWSQVKEMSDLGVEFCSHTHTHARLSDITEAQIIKEYEDSKKKLRERGYNDRLIVYPYGADSELVRKKTREYFEVGVDVDEGINYPPLSTFQLKRVTLAEATNNTLDYYKSKVDEAIIGKGWLIFKSHSQYESFDSSQIQIIKDLIDYIHSKGVDIVSLSQGLRVIGNIMDVGDYPARSQAGVEYYVMDVDGKIYSKSNQKNYDISVDTSLLFTTPITAFPHSMMSTNIILEANAAQFPMKKAGILNTFRFVSGQDAYAYQTFQSTLSNEVYRRKWDNNTGLWLPFECISKVHETINIDVPDIVVSANSTTDSVVTWGSVLATDIVHGVPNSTISPGLTYSLFVQAGKVIIRVANCTGTSVTLTARKWRLNRIPL